MSNCEKMSRQNITHLKISTHLNSKQQNRNRTLFKSTKMSLIILRKKFSLKIVDKTLSQKIDRRQMLFFQTMSYFSYNVELFWWRRCLNAHDDKRLTNVFLHFLQFWKVFLTKLMRWWSTVVFQHYFRYLIEIIPSS